MRARRRRRRLPRLAPGPRHPGATPRLPECPEADPRRHWTNWEANSVVNHVEAFAKASPALIIDCGHDDFFLDVNRAMHRRLTEAGVPHEYRERPGAHNAAYWSSAVNDQLAFFDRFFGE